MSAPGRLRPSEDPPDAERRVQSLVEEGRIWEAQVLLKDSGDLIPPDSKIREILSPPRVKESDFRDFDRSAEFHWIKVKSAAHQGKWVALLGEDLLASSDTLKELLARPAELHPERRPLIHHLI